MHAFEHKYNIIFIVININFVRNISKNVFRTLNKW
jgi:hypothetical protein